ncbi:hypothetical protein [Flaviflagellibacter deserti]|uniref:hypothetical protein n=1 Tax=Flaviflagellibacter deserti TaxID=2267266 RepID=UPI0036D2FEF0
MYERARQAIVKQLRSYDPPLTESEITKERLALEEAVRKIETEARVAAAPPKAPPPRPGGEGQTKVQSAAADAASLGAAAANAQVSVNTTRAAFEPDPPRAAPPPRMEPRFEPPRAPVAPPEPRPFEPRSPEPRSPESPSFTAPVRPGFEPSGDARPFPIQNGDVRDIDEDEPRPRSRVRVLAAVAVTVLVAAGVLGGIAYMSGDGSSTPTATNTGPKISDRVGDQAAAPTIGQGGVAREVPAEQTADVSTDTPPAPSEPVDPGTLVSQRAILYEEAPDQQGGNAFAGQVVWRTGPAPGGSGETEIRGEITIPERNIKVTLALKRNLDSTLPASHTIDIQFTLPPDFSNAGIGNVPGILFKPTEEAGGSALTGLSVKVMSNMFLIGLSDSPTDREQNLKAIRERSWIDVPILYENGRRAVLTLEKGPPGERAFNDAFAAWDAAPPIASSNSPVTPR